MLLLPPPKGGENLSRAGRESAVPTVATVIEYYRCARSVSLTVGVVAVAGTFVALVIAPNNCLNFCFA